MTLMRWTVAILAGVGPARRYGKGDH